MDAGTIAEGSAAQAFEGHHDYKCMGVHKKRFDTLVQLRLESVTSIPGVLTFLALSILSIYHLLLH